MHFKIRYQILAVLLIVTSCKNGSFVPVHDTISLNGSWRFALDTAKAGVNNKWYSQTLSDSVNLPGTLDENGKGLPNLNRGETMRLSRERMYAGMAWYQKSIVIPDKWKGQYIRLLMEKNQTHTGMGRQ